MMEILIIGLITICLVASIILFCMAWYSFTIKPLNKNAIYDRGDRLLRGESGIDKEFAEALVKNSMLKTETSENEYNYFRIIFNKCISNECLTDLQVLKYMCLDFKEIIDNKEKPEVKVNADKRIFLDIHESGIEVMLEKENPKITNPREYKDCDLFEVRRIGIFRYKQHHKGTRKFWLNSMFDPRKLEVMITGYEAYKTKEEAFKGKAPNVYETFKVEEIITGK